MSKGFDFDIPTAAALRDGMRESIGTLREELQKAIARAEAAEAERDRLKHHLSYIQTAACEGMEETSYDDAMKTFAFIAKQCEVKP